VGVRNLGATPEPLFGPGQSSVLIINNDTVNTIWLGQSSTALTIPLPPQAGVTVDGASAWWGASLSAAVVQCLILPGGAQWSNPVGVQVAIDALGLATADNQVTGIAAVGTVNTTLGVPAQTDDVITTLPSNIQTMGAPPYVPNMATKGQSQITPGDSPVSLVTLGTGGRLWYAAISLVAACSSTTPTASGIFAQLSIGSEILLDCETAIAAASQVSQSDQNISFGGFPVAAGGTVELNLNNGNSVTDVFIRASAVLYYSVP
jgi:hypothetical protein